MVTIARLRQAMQGRPWFTVRRTTANVHSEGSRLCLLPLETGYGENAGHAEKNALLMYRLQSIEF
jgi:hypothetical protein